MLSLCLNSFRWAGSLKTEAQGDSGLNLPLSLTIRVKDRVFGLCQSQDWLALRRAILGAQDPDPSGFMYCKTALFLAFALFHLFLMLLNFPFAGLWRRVCSYSCLQTGFFVGLSVHIWRPPPGSIITCWERRSREAAMSDSTPPQAMANQTLELSHC